MKNLFQFILLLLFLPSCILDNGSDCFSEYLGEVKLSPESLEYIAFEEQQQITFINESNEELAFSYDESLVEYKSENLDTDVLYEVCQERLFGDPMNYSRIHFSIESRAGAYKSERGSFVYRLEIDGFQDEEDKLDTLLYDVFTIVGEIDEYPFEGLQIFTSSRGRNGETGGGVYQFLGDTILLGRSFKNVYQSKTPFNRYGYLYTVSEGVIGLNKYDELWVLKN